jgi:hypothetical protein
MREVKRREFDAFALDIHPHIHLGEIRQGKDAEMLSGMVSAIEEIPQPRALVFGSH